MDFISVTYLLFLLILLFVYYMTPKNKQWIVLLVFSVIFYSCFSLTMWFGMLLTAVTTYAYARFGKHSKGMLIATIILNIGIMLGLKTATSAWICAGNRLGLFGISLTGGNFFLHLTNNRIYG